MAAQKIQMQDYAGNKQYPVTLMSYVYDEGGNTLSDRLAALEVLLDWFEWGDDEKGSVKTKYHFWSEQQLGAGGIGEELESGGTGTGVMLLTAWDDSLTDLDSYALGANLGKDLRDRIETLEGKATAVTYDPVLTSGKKIGELTIDGVPKSLFAPSYYSWSEIQGVPTHLSQFTDDVVAGHYLPLTGGTIISNSYDVVIFDTTFSGSEARLVLKKNNEYKSLFGWSLQNGTMMYNAINGYHIGITDSGVPQFNSYALLHSGNIGEYAARSYSDVGANNVKGNALGYSYATEEHGGRYAGGFISFGVSTYGCQLQGDADGNGLVFRGYSPSGFTPWKTVAFTDSNVASADYASNAGALSGVALSSGSNTPWGTIPMITEAGWMDVGKHFEFHYDNTTDSDYSTVLRCTGNYENVVNLPSATGTLALLTDTVEAANRLATARTIWGQSFDGTGNVNGEINTTGNINIYGGSLSLRPATNVSGVVEMGSSWMRFQALHDGVAYLPILLNPNGGNVGIGTTSPTYKLDVNGNTHLDAYDGVSYVHLGPLAFGTKIQARGNGNTYFQSQRFDDTTVYYNIILQELGGQVGIGTSAPDEMLHVAGNIRLKNASNYGCFLKFGDGEYCHLYEDSDDHLKIYAAQGIALLTDGKGVTTDQSLTIGSAVLSWDSDNNALKIEGNVYATGQIAAGGVGTEVQKVFNIAAVIAEEGKEEEAEDKANKPYTATLAHNLNTYDLAVVVYEVEEIAQSDGTTTEKLTQVLADVTLTDENNVMVYFASRKINRKYRIVIIG